MSSRGPRSLFNGLASLLLCHDSSRHLFLQCCWFASSTSTFCQSIWCSSLHVCSASTDALVSPFRIALWCSFTRLSHIGMLAVFAWDPTDDTIQEAGWNGGTLALMRSFYRVISGLNLTSTFCSHSRIHLIDWQASNVREGDGRLLLTCSFFCICICVVGVMCGAVTEGRPGEGLHVGWNCWGSHLSSRPWTYSVPLFYSPIAMDKRALAHDSKLLTTDFLW